MVENTYYETALVISLIAVTVGIALGTFDIMSIIMGSL